MSHRRSIFGVRRQSRRGFTLVEVLVTLLLTEWKQYREIDPVGLAAIVRQRNMLDGRNALDPQQWRAAGWTYRALGRPRA